jgi:ribosomal protein S6--L-glutamate ligase
MRFAVLSIPQSWYFRDLVRAAGSRHELVPLSFRQLNSAVRGGKVGVASGPAALGEFDAVLVRTMPPGSLEQVVFRMDALARLEGQGTVVVNPPRAIEAAVDKYLATARLAEAGFEVPDTIACQTVDEAMAAFEDLGRDVVIKPLFGSEGRGITRLTDADLACRAFSLLEQLGGVIYLQRFIPHEGSDLRLLVIGRKVLAIRRRHATDWRTNVSRGAAAEPYHPSDEQAALAQRAAECLGAVVAGVDLLPGLDGRLYAIEVNAVPGWRGLAAALSIDVAAEILCCVESIVAARDRR